MRGEDPRGLLELAYRVLEGGELRPLEDPTLYRVALMLIEANIAYPRYEPTSITFKPPSPSLQATTKDDARKGVLSALRVDAAELVKRLQRVQGG